MCVRCISDIGTLDIRVTYALDDGCFLYSNYAGRSVFGSDGTATYGVATPLFEASCPDKHGELERFQFISHNQDVQFPSPDDPNGFIEWDLYKVIV